MARKSTTVVLQDPFDFHEKRVTEIMVLEPTGGQYATLGEPLTFVRHKEGQGYTIEQSLVIGQYLDRCIDHASGAGAALLDLMSLVDAKRVRGALLGFFTDADLAILVEKQKSSSLTSTS